MLKFKILATLTFYHLTLIRAISIPSPLQALPAHDAVPRIITPHVSFNLSAPLDPSGFSVKFTFNEKAPLRPLEVYINTIEMMSSFSALGWNSNVMKSIGFSGPNFLTEICAFPLLPDEIRLPSKFVISGLFKAGVEIANSQRFCQLEVGLFQRNPAGKAVRVGYLELRPKGLHPGPVASGLPSGSKVDVSLVEGGTLSNTSIGAPSGRINVKDDKGFSITYHWNGNKLKAQDLFSSFLNALAIASVHDNGDLRAFVPNAPAASGDVVLTTWEVSSPAADRLTWGRVKEAVHALWTNLCIAGSPTGKPRFEDFEFEFWDGKDKIGGGRVLKFDFHDGASNGTTGRAVSR